MSIGERIKFVRKQFNLTQEEFAARLGIKTFSVSRYETGSRLPNINTLKQLNQIFMVNLNWLISGRGSVFEEGNIQN